MGVFITGIYCGMHYISICYPYIPSKPERISTGHATITINDGELAEICVENNMEEEIFIGNESIPAGYFPLIGCGFDAIDHISELSGMHIPEINESSDNYRWFSKFSNVLRISLAAAFLVLIVNYIFYSHYYNEAIELQSIVEVNQSMLNHYDSLLSEFNEKKEFLSQAGLLEKPNISYYSDQIAASTPPLIVLNAIDVFPVTSASINDGNIVPKTGVIEINGNSPDPLILHSWVDIMSEFEWVLNARVMEYAQESRSKPASFSILINTKQSP